MAEGTAVSERVGVVFVHGIGSQTQSSTLRMWADPLVDWLTAWHHDVARKDQITGSFRISESCLSYGEALGSGVPAHLRLSIPKYAGSTDPTEPAGDEAEWILTEGWWASRLDAPSFATMTGWSIRIYLEVIVRLFTAILARIGIVLPHRWPGVRLVRMPESPTTAAPSPGRPAAPKRRGAGQWLRALTAGAIDVVGLVGLGIGYAVFGFAGFFVVVVPLLLIAQIPIRQVQEFTIINTLRLFLVENVGDFYTYLHDEIQALHIRRGVLETIAWLERQGCQRICLAGHSQGTVIAYDVVTQTDLSAPAGVDRVTKLITVGEALNNAWRLKPQGLARLRKPTAPLAIRWVDLWSIYDPVPGDRLEIEKVKGADYEPIEAHNGMNVLTEHGGYFTNAEEVVSRLAQEIDRPAEDPDGKSRFWLPTHTERKDRRIGRVRVLLSWRIVGIALFVVASVVRARSDGIPGDGNAILALLGRIPATKEVVSPLGAFPGLVSAVSVLLGLAAYAVVFETAYALFVLPIWNGWDRRVRDLAARKSFPPFTANEGVYATLGSIVAVGVFVLTAALVAGRS